MHLLKPKTHSIMLLLISLMIFPMLVGFSPDLLDKIRFGNIRDLQLKKEGKNYLIETFLVIQYTGDRALKLDQGVFEVAVILKDGREFPLGTVRPQEITIDPPANADAPPTETLMPMTLNLGTDLQTFLQGIDIAGLMTEAEPTLKVHLQGKFNLGMKATQFWGYQEGLNIDWIVTPAVSHAELLKLAPALTGKIPLTPVPHPGATPTPNNVPGEPTPTPASNPSDRLTSVTPYTVLFTSRLNISPEKQQQFANWAQSHFKPGTNPDVLHIDGHADSSVGKIDNQTLSEQRAAIVYQKLIELGFTWKHVVLQGFGATRLILDQHGVELVTESRRVELYLSDK